MRKSVFAIATLALSLGATSALSDTVSESMQCKLVGDKTEEDVIAAAEKWLAAARTVGGGEELRLSIHFPVAGGEPDTDFVFVLWAPSFAAWGQFWDNYPESAAEAIDDAENEITECSSGRLFSGVEIEPAE